MDSSITNLLLTNQARKEHLVKQMTGSDFLEKALSPKDFEAKYGTNHEVFTTKDLSKYVADSLEGKEQEEKDLILKSISSEFSTLNSVLIKDSKEQANYKKVYVREKSAQVEETEEKEN